mmetsp:Transcript_9433/g.23149  ORF Transcript_9433/g.23149 Transcript_9433/m.23149 type:complete len:218 (+) Transcript_9433:113-766(+)
MRTPRLGSRSSSPVSSVVARSPVADTLQLYVVTPSVEKIPKNRTIPRRLSSPSVVRPKPMTTSTFSRSPSRPSRRMARTASRTTASTKTASSVDSSRFTTFLGMSSWPRSSPRTRVTVFFSEGAVRMSITPSKLEPVTSVPSIRSSTSRGATRPLFHALPALSSFDISRTRTPLFPPAVRSSRIIPSGFSRSIEYSPAPRRKHKHPDGGARTLSRGP